MRLPSCVRCIHYFITYEPGQPYGCRAMGFKSRQNPALVVYRSSGAHCQMFAQKDTGTKEGIEKKKRGGTFA